MLDELYAEAFTTASFAGWTTEILAPHGFTAANTLPLVGVCGGRVRHGDHGPDGARVAVREAWVSIGSGDPQPLT